MYALKARPSMRQNERLRNPAPLDGLKRQPTDYAFGWALGLMSMAHLKTTWSQLDSKFRNFDSGDETNDGIPFKQSKAFAPPSQVESIAPESCLLLLSRYFNDMSKARAIGECRDAFRRESI